MKTKTLFTKNKSLNKVIDSLKTNLRTKDKVINHLSTQNIELKTQLKELLFKLDNTLKSVKNTYR